MLRRSSQASHNTSRSPGIRAGVALVLFALAIAGPRIVLECAADEGLLLRVLTADQSRDRTAENPQDRTVEDRALIAANLAFDQPLNAINLFPSSPIDETREVTPQTSEQSESLSLDSSESDADTPRAPPLSLCSAPPEEKRNVDPDEASHESTTRFGARAPPHQL